MPQKNTPERRIRAFTRRTGWALASHLFPGGYFVVTRAGKEGREWRLARFTSKWTFEVGEQASPLQNGGYAMLHRALAANGHSPASPPKRLIVDSKIPRFPRTILEI